MTSHAMRQQRRGSDVPPLSSSSSSLSPAHTNDAAVERGTPRHGTEPLSSSSSTSSADHARRAAASVGGGGVWGPARSPTIRPPPGVAFHPTDDTRVVPPQPPSASTPSATPPPTALVMESLARRYRAEESRLLRWRLGGSKPVAPRSSTYAIAAGGAGGRGAGGAPDAPGTSASEKGGAAAAAASFAAAAAASAAGRGSAGERLRASVVAAVQRSQMARAVQAWWRGRAQLHRLAAKARRRRHARTTTAGGFWFDDAVGEEEAEQDEEDAEVAGVGRGPAHDAAPTAERPAASALSAWVHSAGRAFLRRFSPALEVSSAGQHCVRVELHQRGVQRRAAAPHGHRGDDGDSQEDGESEGSPEGAAALLHAPQHRDCVVPESTQPRGDTAGDAVGTSLSPTSSSSSSSAAASSRASREGSKDADTPRAPHAAAEGDSTVDEGRFTLSWVRGLRGGGSATAVAGDADDSFRSASRLLARSRAGFARWLRRQRRLQAARRSLHRVRAWRPSHRHTGQPPSSPSAAAAPLAGALSPTLRARTAHVQPSPWEAPLPACPGAAADGTGGGHGALASQTRQRAQLLAAVAAGTAAWQAQLRRSDAKAGTAPAGDASAAKCAPTGVPRAVQRARDDAAALARLSGSLAALTQLERRASAVATRPACGAEGESGEVGERGAAKSASPSSILSAPPYPDNSRRPSTQNEHVCTGAEAPDDGGAFQSLIRETTHTPRDAAVRAVYEAVMGDVCAALVQDDLDNAVGLRQSAADRALVQWMERQVLQELLHPSDSEQQQRQFQQHPQPLDCTGVLRHLRTRVPVSLACLRLDEADRRALENVRNFVRGDATAAVIGTAGFKISYAELASLRAGEWLNDQVINNYLELLRLEAATAPTPPLQRHAISVMSTHFYAKVEQELGAADVRGSDAAVQALPPLSAKSDVLRWLRRKQDALQPYNAADPQAVRAVLVPVNIEAQHWALAVLYRADQRWVLYDSLSRSDASRRRGAAILARLAHAWREAQRHYGHLEDGTASASVAPTAEDTAAVAAAEAPSTMQPWVSACVVAAPCTRAASTGPAPTVSPLDSLAPYGSLDGLRRAEKRLRHHENILAEQAAVKATRGEDANTHAAGPHAEAPARSPVDQWTDAEVSWFTGGFDRAPQQANGYDCGVFVCQAAWCVAQGVAVDFTQADVSLLRSVITLELLSKQLLRRYPTAYTSGSAGV